MSGDNKCGPWKEKFCWLTDDKACAKAVDELVAHSGLTETKARLIRLIINSGVDDVGGTFAKLLEKGIIKKIPSKCEWEYEVSVVTEKGSPYSGKLYGDLSAAEKAQKKRWQKQGLL